MNESEALARQFILLSSSSPTHKVRTLMSVRAQTYAIGAAFVDMLLEGVIRLDEKGKLEVIRHTGTGDVGSDMILQKLMKAGKPKTMKRWIQSYYSLGGDRKKTFEALAMPLIRQGRLQQEQYRVLFLIPAVRYLASAEAKDHIIQRMRAELLEKGPVSDRTAALAMLLEVCKLLKHYFSNYEQRELKLKLQQLHQEQSKQWNTIRQIKKAIDEIDGAIASSAAAGGVV